MSCTRTFAHKCENVLYTCEMGHCFAPPWGGPITSSPARRGSARVPSILPAQDSISPFVLLYFFRIKEHTRHHTCQKSSVDFHKVNTPYNQCPDQDLEHPQTRKPAYHAPLNITLILGQSFLLIKIPLPYPTCFVHTGHASVTPGIIQKT